MLVGPEVVPSAGVGGEVNPPTRDAGLKHGADEVFRSEHVLAVLTERLGVVTEVEYERPHHRIALLGDLAGAVDDIRLQGLAEVDVLHEDFLRGVAVPPRLGAAHVAMHAHERQEAADLDPANHPLLVLLALVLVRRAEEAAGVEGPPREAGGHESEAAGDLPLQGAEVIAHVAGPGYDAVALDAREGRARQDGRFLLGNAPEALVHRPVHHERIYVTVELAGEAVLADGPAKEVVVLRLSGVEPPRVDAEASQAVKEILAIIIGCIRVEEIDPVRAFDIVAVAFQRLADLALPVDLGPDRQHEMDIVLVESVGQSLGIRIVVLVETQGVPAVFSPPLPVLDDHVEGNAPLLESGGVLEDLIRRAVALAAMDVSEHPFGHLRDFAGELAVRGYALVGISGEYSEVKRRCHG